MLITRIGYRVRHQHHHRPRRRRRRRRRRRPRDSKVETRSVLETQGTKGSGT